MNPNKKVEKKVDTKASQNGVEDVLEAETSMTTLIFWNISKALHRNPHLDLKLALKNAFEHLGNSRDVNKFVTQSPEERHLACALLAWQELGHTTVESLYEFVEDKYGDQERDKGQLPKPEKKVETVKRTDLTNQAKDTEISKYPQSVSTSHPAFIPHRESKDFKASPASIHYSKTPLTKNNDGAYCYIVCKEEVLGHKSNGASNSKPCKIHDRIKTESVKYTCKPIANKESVKCTCKPAANEPDFLNTYDSYDIKCESYEKFDTCSLKGPVVTLPPDTKVVMRFDGQNSPCSRHQGKKPRAHEKDIMSKIDAACCINSGCADRLAELDKTNTELRNRASRLGRREAERVELLERAEAAWKDLEMGYQRRLVLAEEKEYDMVKQTKKLIEERNGYKTCCVNLAKLLKDKAEATEQARANLIEVEKEMCSLACNRMRLSEEAARGEAGITEQHIKVSQLDRDLQFKEEQTRRKLLGVQSQVESVRALAVEAERAMRAELSALREQVANVSKQLLSEDEDTTRIQAELESLRTEKSNLVEDLEGCQLTCDSRMQKKMDELKKLRDTLAELKEKVIECQCKLPMDASVEVKRTPSLMALCACAPEDRLLEACSCTSLRTQLLTNLFADLFGGLQAEVGEVGMQMPCQLLKCLEDKHNWNRTTVVKTNLHSFFSRLLIGELDIAIATSIEKYHARWVGASCADAMRMIPDPGESCNEGWQERAIERRAQKLANKLAEQLFQERANQLVQRAKDVVKTAQPPCECKETAVFPCLVNPPTIGGGNFDDNNTTIPTYWRKTLKDVTQLRVQIEDLKKETLKIEDLKKMENNIFKLVQRPSEPEPPIIIKDNIMKEQRNTEGKKDIKYNNRSVNTEGISKYSAQPPKYHPPNRKKHLEIKSVPKKGTKKIFYEPQLDRTGKNGKKVGVVQEFAVNTCLCENQNMPPKLKNKMNKVPEENEDKIFRKQPFPSSKHSKPISEELDPTMSNIIKSNTNVTASCKSNCVCFHKVPSNTSIDKLLEKLTKWRFDLNETPQEAIDIKDTTLTSIDEKPKQEKAGSSKHELGVQSNLPHQDRNIKLPIIINHNKATDMNLPNNMQPNSTDSEYMGEINLDKSNDQCKCIARQIRINKNKFESKDKKEEKKEENKVQDSIFKCINSELCQCKKSLENKKGSPNKNNRNSHQEPLNKTIDKNNSIIEPKFKNFESPKYLQNFENNLQNSSQHKELSEEVINDIDTKNHTKTSDNHVAKSSDLLSCDCDYNVKLLGVTLANNSSHKVFDESKVAISNRKNKTEFTINSNNLETTYNTPNKDEYKKDSCVCHLKFDEFKNYMENTFKKQWGDDHPKTDKELDVPSFKETKSSNEEACICCNSCPRNESQELEVNTFYLLEEHLRGRLEELRKSCCMFSCLSPGEEEKLFSAILQRVKQIISSSTSGITCKCKEGKQSDGSWNRANTLLQEYLKTKIKKVQCLCAEEDAKQECVLPKLLDEIHGLIESDFQRLKNVYNSQNTQSNVNDEKSKDEIPEKDTSPNSSTSAKDVVKLSKLNSNTSIIVTQTTSAQVPVNLGMDSKSCDCDVVGKGSKDVQTSESFNDAVKMSYNSVETQNEMRSYDAMIDSHSLGTQEVLVNHHYSKISDSEFPHSTNKINLDNMGSNSMENFNKQSSSPYIGYTIDCSYKCALGICTCIKSTIKENNEQINNIWNDLTRDNMPTQNISYIMDSIYQKPQNEPIDLTGLSYSSVKSSHSNQTTKYNESEISDDDIVLIDSNRNVTVSNNSVNTTQTNDFADEDRAKIEENDQICSCHIIKPILKNNVRSESYLPYSTNMHKTQTLNCDCTMIPICHVKMLVDNLEDRLFHSKCTCDSFNARVCPVHSKIYY